jgi:hypothetical protein
MFLKIFGLADILAIIALLFATILPQDLVILMAIYLIIKGFIFILMGGIFPSGFDILSGFYLIIASFGISHWIMTLIVIIFLLQKAVVSLL